MSVAIQGVKIVSVCLSRETNGDDKVTGEYHLISNTDKVLAKQSFNGYSDIKISLSQETQKALNDFHKNLKKDAESFLGLGGE